MIMMFLIQVQLQLYLLFISALFLTTTFAQDDFQKKPNILLILADDVGTGDIPVYWNSSIVKMPNIERLAKLGVRFKDAHSTPLCAPSRYMLLSGNYAHRGFRPNGSWMFWENQNQFLNHQKSIATVLSDAGYQTGMFGKWHLGARLPTHDKQDLYPIIKDYGRLLSDPLFNWNEPIIEGPQEIGFDHSYITVGGIQDPPYSFMRDGYLTTSASDVRYWEKGWYEMPFGTSIIGSKHPGEGDKNWDSTAYNMIIVNETSQFIDDHLQSNPENPFFAYVALGAAHVPHSPPDKYLDGSPVKGEYLTRHACMLLEMDKVVGSLVSLIENKQIAEDTIIIFTSDNGGLLKTDQVSDHRTSGPLRGSKSEIYEGGHRVPLIMRYDGSFPSNKIRNRIVGLNDLYATICHLIGVEIPSGSAQDSVSFAEYITSTSKETQKKLRTSIGTWTYKNSKLLEEAIRLRLLKLIHSTANSTYELYDLAADVSETVDLINEPKYAKKVRRMKRRLSALSPCPTHNKVHEGLFFVSKLNATKGCRWFEKKTLKRCEKHFEGGIHCGNVCVRNQEWCQ